MLGPSGNIQGGYKFMSLSTGKKITHYSWDAIPMPDTVIAHVNTLGKDQPEQLVFTDWLGRIIRDNKIPGVDTYHNELDNDVELPGVDGTEVMGTNP